LASKLFWLLFSVPRLLFNTLNKLTKADKTTQYNVYDYQGNRVRTVIESNQQTQSQIDYLPALDISINQAKQQSTTLHIGTHILSKSSKDNTQTHYQLNSHPLVIINIVLCGFVAIL
jgi:insecticidal toxin complex protein TccC